MTLIEEEIRVSTEITDMYKHIPILKRYSTLSDRVIEIGVRDMNSSWGLLTGLPRWMISYDIYPPTSESMLECFKHIANENNVVYEFFIQDSLTLDMPEVDFLFIDSMHTYSHLKQELELHNDKVTTYIGFHDTQLFAHRGQQNSNCEFKNTKGLLNAVHEFLKANRNWIIDYHTDNCNGLTIIKRVS